MTESAFWALLRNKIPGHLHRIENASGSGTPDVHAYLKGFETFIELKKVHGNAIKFQPSQVAFYYKRPLSVIRIMWKDGNKIGICQSQDIMKHLKLPTVDNPEVTYRINIKNTGSILFNKPWNWLLITNTIFSSNFTKEELKDE